MVSANTLLFSRRLVAAAVISLLALTCLLMTLAWPRGLHAQALPPILPCPETPDSVGDANCDGAINLVDLQIYAAYIGGPAPSPEMDLDADGIFERDELQALAAGWRQSVRALMGGPARLGYAVGPQGNVFLRWALPVSPYSGTVTILRQPPPPNAPTLPARPQIGVVAAVAPIVDDATAIPLLGADWPLLRTAFSTTTAVDGSTLPYTLTTVAEMHAFLAAGENPFIAQSLSSQHPGTARVLGRGYFDSAFQATGVYTYWVRSNGRTVGPLVVDTTQRTRLPAP
ncbi:MAG: hypothetical protein ACRC1H_14975, partial [Caldilineaceae bacterium]